MLRGMLAKKLVSRAHLFGALAILVKIVVCLYNG